MDVDWSKWRRNWFDDGDDCLGSSIAESLRVTYGEDAPTLEAIEAAYYRWHPHWDNRASSIDLPTFWRALARIGISMFALHHAGDLLDQIAVELAQARYPIAWIWLDSRAGWPPFHHSVVVVGYSDGMVRMWDQQIGIARLVPVDRFIGGAGDGASSGYAYTAFWSG